MLSVVSFCLYGPPNHRYYLPLLDNIQIVAQYFPGWKVYVYVAPDVDPNYLRTLHSYSNVVVRPTGVPGPINMIYRFFAIDEPEVDLMMVRDADSLIHWKDRWAIHQFVAKPEFVAHAIRDNAHHTSYMMGGLWGLRKEAGLNIAEEYRVYLQDPKNLGVAHDQNFLSSRMYPQLKDRMLVHYSEGPLLQTYLGKVFPYRDTRLFDGEHGELFPFPWSETMYCGCVALPLPPRKVTMPVVRIRM